VKNYLDSKFCGKTVSNIRGCEGSGEHSLRLHADPIRVGMVSNPQRSSCHHVFIYALVTEMDMRKPLFKAPDGGRIYFLGE
jgi:hypothetical protein